MILRDGNVIGQTQVGTFSIPIASLSKVAFEGDTFDKTASDSGVEVTLKDGTTLSVTNVKINGTVECRDSRFDDWVELSSRGLRYWVEESAILKYGLRTANAKAIVSVKGSTIECNPPDNSTTLETSTVKLEGKLNQITLLDPIDEHRTAESDAEQEASLRVIVGWPDGSEKEFAVRQARFVNYPASGWTGSYFPGNWPFQWWPSDTVDVVKTDGAGRMKVRIDKISVIEVIDGYQKRGFRFTSRNGSTLPATHFYEILNEDSKHGPYRWEKEKEGLLLTLDDFGVMVPFVAVSQIRFEYPEQ